MDWNEERIRKQTGWKAFREGQAIARHGKVVGFKRGKGLLTGSFKQGRRPLRTVVRLTEHLSVECGCPENRATGEVCAHGVALLLTAIEKPSETKPPQQEEPPKGELLACRIAFPESLGKMLGAGRLSAQVERDDSEPDEADAAFSLWLARHSPGGSFPKLLSLGAAEIDAFLTALARHRRLRAGSMRVSITNEHLAPLRLDSSEIRDDRIRLQLDSNHALLPVRWGRHLGGVQPLDQEWLIGRLPVETPSLVWRDEAAELMERGYLDLPLPEFLSEADAWLDLFQSPLPGSLGELRFEASEPQFTLRLEGSLNALDASAEFRYPGLDPHPLSSTFSKLSGLPKLSGEGALKTRSRNQEESALGRLISTGMIEGSKRGDFTLRNQEAALSFLADELPSFRKDWNVIIGSRLEHVLKSLHVIRPKLESTQSLAWELSFQTDAGKSVPEAKIREILRSGRRSVRTSNGATVAISSQIPEVIEPLLADLGIPTKEGKIQADRAKDLVLQKFCEKAGNHQKSSESSFFAQEAIPPSFKAELRPYQIEGYQWLTERLDSLSGALLADDMGLGKTIQTIALICRLKGQKSCNPVLILAPATLLGNWRSEVSKFAPDLRIITLHGSERDELRDEVSTADIVITSYGTLCRDLAFHLKQEYGLLVADEASLLRNPKSQTSRSVAKLKAARRLALTGTPVENRLRDLWAIFRIIAPSYLGSMTEFVECHEGSIGSSSAQQRLRLRISPFVLRRTKSEVAKDLPEKTEIDEWLNLDPECQQTYASLARAGLQELEEQEKHSSGGNMHLLTLLLRLRQLCLDPRLIDEEAREGAKTARLKAILEERAETRSKTLVFSQFRRYLHLMRNDEALDHSEIFMLDGSTRNRAELVQKFQEHEGSAVFLISLKAGGYGLNLTSADTVVHMDPWWNPAVEAQASDRAHRIGQTQPVSIYKLLTRDTVEERVRRMQNAKQSLMNSVTTTAAPGNWSESDLRSLID